MSPSPYNQAPEPFLPTLRALAETYEQVFRASTRHIETLGLTSAQFDVLATLGDSPGMTCKELGERTLITKGTLTGVLDRLEDRGLVYRSRGERDNRQVYVHLTPDGERIFKATFQPHIDWLSGFFENVEVADQAALITLLGKLKQAFEGASAAAVSSDVSA
jgi:DNA-binding MarR family transcriptional regulator